MGTCKFRKEPQTGNKCHPLSLCVCMCVCVCVRVRVHVRVSVSDFLKRPLEQYVRRLEVRVSVIRMEQRSGLIRARLKGASISTGQVCVCVCVCVCTQVPVLNTVLACLSMSLDVICEHPGHHLPGCPL